jgi:hypothetical protein
MVRFFTHRYTSPADPRYLIERFAAKEAAGADGIGFALTAAGLGALVAAGDAPLGVYYAVIAESAVGDDAVTMRAAALARVAAARERDPGAYAGASWWPEFVEMQFAVLILSRFVAAARFAGGRFVALAETITVADNEGRLTVMVKI